MRPSALRAVWALAACVVPLLGAIGQQAQAVPPGPTNPIFVYASTNNTDPSANAVSGWSVGADGALSELDGSPWLTHGAGNDLDSPPSLVDQARGDLYVANIPHQGGQTIAAFHINPQSGVLTPIGGSPFSTGVGGDSDGFAQLAMSPDGSWLVLSRPNPADLVVLPIENDGSLGPPAVSPVPNDPYYTKGMAFSDDGRFLAVAEPLNHRVSLFQVNEIGQLQRLDSVTVATSGSSQPADVQFTRDGKHLLVAAPSSQTLGHGWLLTYPVDDRGQFGTPATIDTDALNSLSIDADGGFAAATVQGQATAVSYVVAADGSLTQAPGNVATLSNDNWMDKVSSDPNGPWLFATLGNGSIGEMQRASDGSLTVLPATPDSDHTTSNTSVGTTAVYDPSARTANSLTTSMRTSAPGERVTLTARVSGPSGPTTGFVEFRSGDVPLGHAKVVNGKAALTADPQAGTNQITAWYSGNSTYTPHTTRNQAHEMGVPAADFDGDGLTDYAVWNPATGRWHIAGSHGTKLGRRTDVPVPGAYVRRGRAVPAVWRPSTGQWIIAGRHPFKLGHAGDVPVPADYNGDGRTDPAVWRPSTGAWIVRGMHTRHLGRVGDIPVPADYSGVGKAQPAVWRPRSGTWLVRGRKAVAFGKVGDVPVPAAYAGGRRVELAVWRPSSGRWFVRGHASFVLGGADSVPLPGRFWSSSRAVAAIWEPATGRWRARHHGPVGLGALGDVPV